MDIWVYMDMLISLIYLVLFFLPNPLEIPKFI